MRAIVVGLLASLPLSAAASSLFPTRKATATLFHGAIAQGGQHHTIVTRDPVEGSGHDEFHEVTVHDQSLWAQLRAGVGPVAAGPIRVYGDYRFVHRWLTDPTRENPDLGGLDSLRQHQVEGGGEWDVTATISAGAFARHSRTIGTRTLWKITGDVPWDRQYDLIPWLAWSPRPNHRSFLYLPLLTRMNDHRLLASEQTHVDGARIPVAFGHVWSPETPALSLGGELFTLPWKGDSKWSDRQQLGMRVAAGYQLGDSLALHGEWSEARSRFPLALPRTRDGSTSLVARDRRERGLTARVRWRFWKGFELGAAYRLRENHSPEAREFDILEHGFILSMSWQPNPFRLAPSRFEPWREDLLLR